MKIEYRGNRFGFSLAEMMIVMLIISIVTAAMLPVITKKQKDSAGGGGHCLWTETTNNASDIYSREAANASVVVGATNRLGSGNEKMQINSTTAGIPQLAFAETGNVMAALMVDSSNNILFGNTVSKGYSPSDSIALGHNVTVYYSNAVAIGSGTAATPTLAAGGGVAIGFQTKSTGVNCVSIGNSAAASDDEAIAIGNTATATDASSIAIGAAQAANIYASAFGASAKAMSFSATALGANSNATMDYSIAIGPSAKATSSSAIAIGNGAVANGDYYGQLKEAIAIGMGANASHVNALSVGDGTISSGEGSVALGKNAWAQSDSTVALGHNAKSRGLNSIAIGNATVASGDHSVSIGDGSGATAQYVTALGYNACSTVTGSNKTCIGANSGPSYGDTQRTDSSEVIYIGTPNSTVYIPGHLVVGKNTILGARAVNDNINYQVYLKGGNKGAYSSWVFLGTDDYKGGDDNFYRVGGVTAGALSISGDNGGIYSDRRLKNIKGLSNDGLDKINELKVFNYTFKKDKKHLLHVGVIAQDLQKVFPNSVTKDKRGYLKIRLDEMFYAMVNAIKELNLKVKDLSETVSALNSRENSTDKKIDELYKKYNNLNNQVYSLKKENKALKSQLKRRKV